MTNDAAFPVGVDDGNIKNFVTCTRKTETPPEKLLHGAGKDKVQPWKETLSKRNVLTRKSDDNDSTIPHINSETNPLHRWFISEKWTILKCPEIFPGIK